MIGRARTVAVNMNLNTILFKSTQQLGCGQRDQVASDDPRGKKGEDLDMTCKGNNYSHL